MIQKKSNKFALMVVAIFVLLPAMSLAVNIMRAEKYIENTMPLIRRISDNDIHVVELSGRKTSEGMLYVQNAWRTLNVIELNARAWANSWDTKWYLSPVPKTEIDMDYGMTHNPGW